MKPPPPLDVDAVRRSCARLREALTGGALTGRALDGVDRVSAWARAYLLLPPDGRVVARGHVLAASADLLSLLDGVLLPAARQSVALALRVADQLRDAEVPA